MKSTTNILKTKITNDEYGSKHKLKYCVVMAVVISVDVHAITLDKTRKEQKSV